MSSGCFRDRKLADLSLVVEHLQTLFTQLVHTDQPSIRPDLELAYLALVTTQDEQEKKTEAEKESGKKAAEVPISTDVPANNEPTNVATSSMDIDDPATTDQPIASTSALPEQPGAMETDTPSIPAVAPTSSEVPIDKLDTEMASSAPDAVSIASSAPDLTTSDLIATELPDGTTEIAPPATKGPAPPPLPPRKKVEEKKASGAGEMMFGMLQCLAARTSLTIVQANNTMSRNAWTMSSSR